MATLDIILPAYNPLPGWESVVINRYLSLKNRLAGITLQLIIVNDGSERIDESGTVKILKENIPGLIWLSYSKNRGKGHALRQGVSSSTSDLIVYTDIDWPYTEESMLGLIQILSGDADAVIGIRDEEYYAHLPKARGRISKLLRQFNGKLLHLKVNDTQAGLKGFKKGVKDIFLSTAIDRYLFDLEFIYFLSRKPDIKVVGFPIKLRPGITFSKMNRKILFQEARNFMKIWIKS
ncbi:MAG TPA: glycosyltransferase [Saprospiraceae bacterium]|nr:glycosyltransferase [Saprospiraceae bacterium]